jgi:hypothetical protein
LLSLEDLACESQHSLRGGVNQELAHALSAPVQYRSAPGRGVTAQQSIALPGP